MNGTLAVQQFLSPCILKLLSIQVCRILIENALLERGTNARESKPLVFGCSNAGMNV